MERLNPGEIPVQEMYVRMNGYWQQLRSLFQAHRYKTPPRLGTYKARVEETDFDKVRKTIELFPPAVWPLTKFWLRDDIGDHLRERTNSSAFFSTSANSVIINRAFFIHHDEDLLNAALIEETTHSLVRVRQSKIKLRLNDLKELTHPYKDFGLHAHSIFFFRTNADEFEADLDEFFPPIAMSFLLGSNYKRFLPNMVEWLAFITRPNPENVNQNVNNEEAEDIVNYLPQLAAERLLDLYEGNSTRLLAQHPEITKLTGPELWQRYCWPLLTEQGEK